MCGPFDLCIRNCMWIISHPRVLLIVAVLLTAKLQKALLTLGMHLRVQRLASKGNENVKEDKVMWLDIKSWLLFPFLTGQYPQWSYAEVFIVLSLTVVYKQWTFLLLRVQGSSAVFFKQHFPSLFSAKFAWGPYGEMYIGARWGSLKAWLYLSARPGRMWLSRIRTKLRLMKA